MYKMKFGDFEYSLKLMLTVISIQGVTGPHRKSDRDDRPCREDHFF